MQMYESLNSNVEIFTYYKNNSPTIIHYKINGGSHEWFEITGDLMLVKN